MLNFFADLKLWASLPRTIRRRVLSLRRGHIVIDLGANVGNISRFFSRFGATVYAFEPDPIAFTRLRRVAKRFRHVFALPLAGGTENGQANLFFHQDRGQDPVAYSSGSSLMKNKPNVGDLSTEVTQVDMARFLNSLGPVQILKVDIEGFEVNLIPHLLAENALESVEFVFVETHSKKWPKLQEATERMIQMVDEAGLARKFDFNWP